ncbi:MAG: hypothetical protein QM726_20300 [Chitinophagaceae bacterium]
MKSYNLLFKMKFFLFLFIFLFQTVCFGQGAKPVKGEADRKEKLADFVTTFHLENPTKDGYYLNGYVVDINYAKAKGLDGKKVRIRGEVTIVKGVGDNKKKPLMQGREFDTKHIVNPIITVIKNNG